MNLRSFTTAEITEFLQVARQEGKERLQTFSLNLPVFVDFSRLENGEKTLNTRGRELIDITWQICALWGAPSGLPNRFHSHRLLIEEQCRAHGDFLAPVDVIEGD